jgi:hypothetical protein
LPGETVILVRRAERNAARHTKTKAGMWGQRLRWSLLEAFERQSERHLAALADVHRSAAARFPLFSHMLARDERHEVDAQERLGV